MKQIGGPSRVIPICFYLRFVSLFLACFLWPNLGFAENLMGGITDSDYSVRFLSNIFGVVDGVLHGSGSQIFGAMFGVFNSAVLTLGTTILGYTLFVSTLRTAHEGEALGRNWSSMWIPFKSATGFALMLPKATGYSMIQIFTMWVVVQGVGAANLVWSAALDYLNSGGAMIQPNTPSLKGSVIMAGDILRSEVCMFMVEESLRKEYPNEFIPSFADSITTITTTHQPGATGTAPSIMFPGMLKNSNGIDDYLRAPKGMCGKVSWSASSQDPAVKQLGDARSVAVLQVITDLVPYAQQIAKDYGPRPLQNNTTQVVSNNTTQAVSNNTTQTVSNDTTQDVSNDTTQAVSGNVTQTVSDDATQTVLKNMSGSVLKNAGNDYEGIIGPAVNLMKTLTAAMGQTSFVQGAKDGGWLMAGSYYQQVVALNRNYATEEKSYPTGSLDYSAAHDKLPSTMLSESGTDPNSPGRLTTFFEKTAPGSASPLNIYIQKQIDAATTSNGGAKGKDLISYNIGSSVGGQIASLLTGGISSIIQGYAELWNNTGDENATISVLNPITSAAILGSGLVSLVTTIWLAGTATIFSVTAIGAICSAINPIGYAIISALSWFMPMLTVLMVTMFVLGATLAYYVPMIPYILFLFGGLGWLIGVIEAIAAAPLVALGIAYPEEHEILGKAQPAVMLLTNIFIRPSLMVIGFIAGISLSYVGIWLLNAGFARASFAAMTAGAGTQGLAWLFMPIAMMSIYTALVVQIINEAFSLIHRLPDEVLRWVGGGGKGFGEDKAEGGVRGAFRDDMGSFGKGASAMASSNADKKEAQDAGGTAKNSNTAISTTNKSSGGGTGTGNSTKN